MKTSSEQIFLLNKSFQNKGSFGLKIVFFCPFQRKLLNYRVFGQNYFFLVFLKKKKKGPPSEYVSPIHESSDHLAKTAGPMRDQGEMVQPIKDQCEMKWPPLE